MLTELLDAYRDARDAFWKVYLRPPYDPNDLRPLEQRVAETRKDIEAHVAELSAERDAFQTQWLSERQQLTDMMLQFKWSQDKVAELEARLAVQHKCKLCRGTGKAGESMADGRIYVNDCPSCGGTGRWP